MMTPTLDTLAFLIHDAARLQRTLFEHRIAQAGLGLTPGEARTLLNIEAADGCRQLEIAARMGVEPMTLCAFLDKLQAKGLIDRQPDPHDRRAKRIVLTPDAAGVIETLKDKLRPVIEQATRGMSTDERDALARALLLFRANLQKTEDPCGDS